MKIANTDILASALIIPYIVTLVVAVLSHYYSQKKGKLSHTALQCLHSFYFKRKLNQETSSYDKEERASILGSMLGW